MSKSGNAVAEDRIILTLYVAGANPSSERAIANIEQIRSRYLGERCHVRVVDVLAQPDVAVAARVMGTPTLVREQPLPERRIIGDLGDFAAVLKAIGASRAGDEN
ncbi:MAG: circadian clock KaiB family protein [Anaerolineae bacterium]|nr:circadian clock KaiB family protein [Anaerolineae bacterium]